MPVAKLIPTIVKPIFSLFYLMAVIILFYIIIIKINFDHFLLSQSVLIFTNFILSFQFHKPLSHFFINFRDQIRMNLVGGYNRNLSSLHSENKHQPKGYDVE